MSALVKIAKKNYNAKNTSPKERERGGGREGEREREREREKERMERGETGVAKDRRDVTEAQRTRLRV